MKENVDWCKTCENKYGSISCIDCCDIRTFYTNLIVYHAPSHYHGKNKGKISKIEVIGDKK